MRNHEETVRAIIIRVMIFGTLGLAITNLSSIDDMGPGMVSIVGAMLILPVGISELRSGMRAERPMTLALAMLVAMWLLSTDPIDRGFLEMQLMLAPVLFTALLPRRWRRIGIVTAFGIVCLAAVDFSFGRATVADELGRVGLHGFVTISLSAIVAYGANARQLALEERTALMEASGAAMIRISYERVLRRFADLRRSGVTDLDTWFDQDEDRISDVIQSIDLISFNDAALALYGIGTGRG